MADYRKLVKTEAKAFFDENYSVFLEDEGEFVASRLVSSAVLSTFFCFIELPEFISIETNASVGLITKYPPEVNFTWESKI